MQVAADALVSGILADCGGACTCATCHVHVDPAWLSRLPPPDDNESAMIDCALHVQDNSRLSCQITLVEALDGLTLHLPPSQT
jgi:2Fe-2S ferredoxin